MPVHLKNLVVYEYEGYINKYLDESYAELLGSHIAYTSIDNNGYVVCCAGLMRTGKNRLEAWTLMSDNSGKHMFAITKRVLKEFNKLKNVRVEFYVRGDFKAGHKWAKMLKFLCETPNGMEFYGEDAHTYYLYSRIF